MNVLIDTDVVLDVALGREPFVQHSGAAMDWAERHPGSAAVAWHTLVNVAYLLKGDPRPFLEDLLGFVVVPATATADARQALRLPVADLEDAFQIASAVKFGADFILTRNTRDYGRSPVPVITPSQFVTESH